MQKIRILIINGLKLHIVTFKGVPHYFPVYVTEASISIDSNIYSGQTENEKQIERPIQCCNECV